jgi:hypothetical protein
VSNAKSLDETFEEMSQAKCVLLTAGPRRMRVIGKDGTVVTVEAWQDVSLDMTNGPWTYMPETEQN